MPLFSAAVSYEFDLKPVLTERFVLEGDFESVNKTGLFRMAKLHPRANPRSVVVVVERLAAKSESGHATD